MARRRRTGLGLCLGVSMIALSAPAFGQDTPDDASSAKDGSILDEIVVTAQKREQNLQKVPLAITAISSAKVEQLGIEDSSDITGLAPNVTISQPTTSLTAGVISIRGIPSGGIESLSLDQANGLYVDGVYIARSAAAALGVTDIERVEVLRGPQGTLFGRNTTGGAIAFISRDPSETFQGSLNVGYGNYGQWNARVSIDTGEIAGIRSSFTYEHSQNDGYVDNLLAPKRLDPGARQSDAFRIALKADIGGTGSFRYIFDYSNLTGTGPAFQLTNVATGAPLPPVSVDGLVIPRPTQAPVAGYLNTVTFLEPQCAALAAPTRAYRDKICLNADAGARDKNWGHNLVVQNDFGGFNFKSTTGYRFWNSDTAGADLDGMGTIRGRQFTPATLFNGMPAALLAFIPSIPAAARPFIAASPVPTTTQDLFNTSNRRRHKQLSQEIEISGDSDALDWVGGGFYFYEKGNENNPQNSGFVLDTNAIFLANFGALGPSFVAANPARYRLVVTNGRVEYNSSAESKAIYGQATYYVGGRDAPLSLTLGGRYTWDTRNIMRFQNGTNRPATPEIGKASFSKFTWNAMARYEFTPETSVYARAATGYRSGGFNPGDTSLIAFRPESVTSYEAGIKSELFDRRLRLNFAAYYNQYKDSAVITTVPSTTTFNTRIINAGRVDYKGFEIEGQGVITDNISIDGNFGFVDVDYKSLQLFATTLPGAPAYDAASIAQATYTSKYTANVALNVQIPIGSGETKLLGRVGYTYLSPQYGFISTLAVPFNDQLRGDAQNLIDAQLTLDKISIGGANAQLKLWAKNLTNDHNFVRPIDFGALGYAGAYYNNPRTFGATLGLKF